ncbi:MAG: glycosyltransferase family 4 protein [Ramlibacter sp.]|nr:glycosyltransferase family 4 protein [Ramlibacter sp.]
MKTESARGGTRASWRPRKALRILSAVGPGDVVTAYRDWKSSVRTPSETSITFSSQEFEFFDRHDVAFWAISSFPLAACIFNGANRIENRPRATTRPVSGLMFHWIQFSYTLSLLISAVRFRATHAVIDSGTTQWFTLSLFRLFGIKVHPNFHNVYWPEGHAPQRRVGKAILRLDGLFFRHCVHTALGVSPTCGRQISEISGGATRFVDYRAQFVRGDFGALPRPVLTSPMRIMFAGRVEESKGVFDILSICEMLEVRRPGQFLFDICGTGAAFESLTQQIEARGLGGLVTLHGKLIRPDLLTVYGGSHLVIVPTRSTFCEGLPMVCAEAVIASRPVITSRLSNALEALRGAIVEAREDDPSDYAAKIEALADDPLAYGEFVRHTEAVSAQFTNPRGGLTHALELCLLGEADRSGLKVDE